MTLVFANPLDPVHIIKTQTDLKSLPYLKIYGLQDGNQKLF